MTHKKKIYIIGVAILFGLAVGAAGYAAYRAFYANNAPYTFPQIISKKTPKPETTTNLLDGTQVDKTNAIRRPLGVIVENYPDARPQTGLDKASIIYEAITEGGITRFMAIYGPRDVAKIGPVRSMRTFFLDMSYEYKAMLAYVGGNIDALDRISAEGAPDLDQFGLGTKAYYREAASGKAIEHTMYTDLAKLYAAAKDKSFDLKADFTPVKFLDPKDFTVEAGKTQQITIDFSSASYKVSYAFDALNNNYPRTMAGAPHKDKITGNQLAPTNIIIQSVSRRHTPTRINEESWTFDDIGEGKAWVIYGGKAIQATWKKPDLKTRTKFYDQSGDEIKFLPGQFWYEIVPPEAFDKVKIENS